MNTEDGGKLEETVRGGVVERTEGLVVALERTKLASQSTNGRRNEKNDDAIACVRNMILLRLLCFLLLLPIARQRHQHIRSLLQRRRQRRR